MFISLTAYISIPFAQLYMSQFQNLFGIHQPSYIDDFKANWPHNFMNSVWVSSMLIFYCIITNFTSTNIDEWMFSTYSTLVLVSLDDRAACNRLSSSLKRKTHPSLGFCHSPWLRHFESVMECKTLLKLTHCLSRSLSSETVIAIRTKSGKTVETVTPPPPPSAVNGIIPNWV